MVSRASGTIEVLEQSRATPEVASITAGSTVLARTIMSSRGARLIGIAIGTVTATIRGTGIVAVSSTAHGSFSISDFSPGSAGPTTPTITIIRIIRTGMGDTVTERMVMIRAFTIDRITTTRADTITTINRTTTIRAETPQLLTINPPPQRWPTCKTNWREQVTTTDKSMVSSDRKHVTRSCAIRVIKVWA